MDILWIWRMMRTWPHPKFIQTTWVKTTWNLLYFRKVNPLKQQINYAYAAKPRFLPFRIFYPPGNHLRNSSSAGNKNRTTKTASPKKWQVCFVSLACFFFGGGMCVFHRISDVYFLSKSSRNTPATTHVQKKWLYVGCGSQNCTYAPLLIKIHIIRILVTYVMDQWLFFNDSTRAFLGCAMFWNTTIRVPTKNVPHTPAKVSCSVEPSLGSYFKSAHTSWKGRNLSVRTCPCSNMNFI